MLGDSIGRMTRWGAVCGLLLAGDLLGAADRFNVAATPAQARQLPADPLLDLVHTAIQINQSRYLDVDVHTPWQIMHGILAFRNDYQLKSAGRKISAVQYISNQARYKGDFWFEKTVYGGRAHPYNGTPYDFEGHVNQFLAILTMCNLPPDHTFVVQNGQTVTMAEMVRHAQTLTSTRGETTWTLWFLTQYLEPDAVWTNESGEPWSIERLVQTQYESRVEGAPCGGCHQLFALALARNAYAQKFGRLRGAWLQADMKLQNYTATAQSHQNRDGSFSTKFFAAREYSDDFETRIKASGHMLEWLMAALPERRLREPWVRRGIETLCRDLITNARASAEPGALYHAVHALVLYNERVAPPQKPQIAELPPVAEPLPLQTAEQPKPIRLQSLEDPLPAPPPPPLSDRKAELALPVLIDEAHPDGANAPLDLFEAPPPLPPRDARPMVIPNPVRRK